MAARAPIAIRYDYQDTYPLTAQLNWAGSQNVPYQRGWWANVPTIAVTVGTAYIADSVRIGHICYIVGNFNTVGGQTRNFAAAFNIYTGALQDWNPNLSATAETVAVGVDADGALQVYIGGNFTTVNGGTTRNRIARFDRTVGTVDATWNPNCDSTVNKIIYRSASSIIAGGSFIQVGGATTRNRVAEFDGTTGAVQALNPNLGAAVLDLAWDSENDRLYIVGSFTTAAGGTVRNRACKWDIAGNSLDAWDPNLGAAAQAVLFRNTGSVIVGGSFTTTAGGATTRNRVAEFNSGGIASAWNPNLDAACTALAGNPDSDIIYLGGEFTTVGGTTRNRLASINTAGTLQPWNPNASAPIIGLSLYDRTILAGGIFTTINGAAAVGGKMISDPFFTDSNTKYVAKTGSNAAAGTSAAPYLTIAYALSQLAGAFVYVVVQDSEAYSEKLNWNVANSGLFAADGQAPTIGLAIGAQAGTYGARTSGRTQFSTGAAGTIYYVSKSGSDSTGARGNSSLPFLTIQGALNDASRLANDTVQIQDSGTYTEDINGGALAVTIQAADGQVPKLVNVVTSGNHFTMTAGNKLSLYGLNVVDLKSSTGNIVSIDANLDCYDCSFSNNVNGLNGVGSSRVVNVQNCLFTGQGDGSSVLVNGTLTCFNCYFTGNRQATTAGIGVIYMTSTSTACSITYCTFKDVIATAAVNKRTDTTATTDTIQFCVFDTIAKLSSNTETGFGVTLHMFGTAAGTMTVSDCYFTNVDRIGVYQRQDSTVDKHALVVRDCLFYRCGILPKAAFEELDGDVYFSGDTASSVNDCISVACGASSIIFGFGAAVTVNGHSCVDAEKYAIKAGVDALTSAAVTGLAEKGSGSGSMDSDNTAFSATYSIVESAVAGTATRGTGSLQRDPGFISDVSNNVNVALLPTSMALLNGNSAGSRNAGGFPGLFRISAANVEVDGLILTGDINFHSGIQEDAGLATGATIEYCSFEGLGHLGLFKGSAGTVKNCHFATNGTGAQIIESGSSSRRNAFVTCGGAGLLQMSANSTDKNNSAYGCAYGHYDAAGASGVKSNLVLSESTVYDYFGVSELVYSDVEVLSPSASVDADSFRQNPLFRAPSEGDLRLQAVAAGQDFTSPAVRSGEDDEDMGAFAFYYGPLEQNYSEIVLDTPYRNPDSLVRTREPIKLAEGLNEDGSTYTTANAYKWVWRFKWDQNANDMPDDQVQELREVFETQLGIVKLDFGDGDGFVDVFVLRETPFDYTEMSGLYGNDEMPTPVREMAFREA